MCHPLEITSSFRVTGGKFTLFFFLLKLLFHKHSICPMQALMLQSMLLIARLYFSIKIIIYVYLKFK